MQTSEPRDPVAPRDLLQGHLGWWLWAIFASGAMAVAAVLGLYAWHFRNNQVSQSHDAWGQFGDFIGGTLNPVLSFLGLISLLLTLWMQSRELRHSGEELRLTRAQLERSAEAQERSERALSIHARVASLAAQLAAATRLIEDLDIRIKEYTLRRGERNIIFSKESIEYHDQLPGRRTELLRRLQGIYDQLSAIAEG